MLIDTYTVNLIYNSLADELSKCVFTKRLAYSLVDSTENLRELARFQIPEFVDKVRGYTDRGDKICVYGVGDSVWYPGRIALTLFNDQLAAMSVFDKRANQLDEISYYWRFKETANIKVNCPELIRQLDSNIVMIVATLNPIFQNEIVKELISLGIPLDKILFFPPLHLAFSGDYFTNSFWRFESEEMFIDCGCFDGDSSRMFMDAVKRQPKASISKIIAYEPDEKQFEVCKQSMDDVPFFSIKSSGVWNKKETLCFSATGRGSSSISATGDIKINAVTLDDELASEKVTFIKMDIEGAELNALKGAENVIRKQRPKLAICVYHKPEDILTITEFIINLNLNYKLYLRHQSSYFAETVLYAVPQ